MSTGVHDSSLSQQIALDFLPTCNVIMNSRTMNNELNERNERDEVLRKLQIQLHELI